MGSMNTTLNRRIGFWSLVLLSVASVAAGGVIVTGELSSMNTTLLDGSATAADVYVGQSLVVVGAALLGVGILGGMLTVAVALLAQRPTEPGDTRDPAGQALSDADTRPAEASPTDGPSERTAESTDADNSDVERDEVEETRAVPVA